MKTVFSLILAAVMAIAVIPGAEAGGKRKLKPELSQQVLSAARQSALDLALLKAQSQVRLKPTRIGKS